MCGAAAGIGCRRHENGANDSLALVDGPAVKDSRKRSRAAYFKRYNAKNGSRSGKRKAPEERRIIAIDGEGYTLADGSHRYTYLAACDEEGLVRELRAPKGVRAGQVLDFLMHLPKKALLVGFALGYDRTKWVESWPDAAVWRLMRPEERLGESGPLPVEWEGYRLNLVSTRTSIKDVETGDRRTVWDVWKFFQSSFVKALERWDVGTAKERKRIAREKARRGSFAGIGKRERAYCQTECRLLAVLVRRLLSAHEEEGLRLGSYYGPGSTAAIILREHGEQRTVYPRDMHHAVMSAYFGGRFECSHVGPVRAKELFAYDIASAYPAAMAKLPCLRAKHGTWVHILRPYWGEHRLALIRWRLEPHKDACPAWGPLPHRLPDGNIVYPVTSAGGWAWSDEFKAAQALHPGVREVESYVWAAACDCPPPFEARIHELYARRLKWGKAARGLVLKLALNSLYGKSAQRVGKGKFRCMVRAGLITSMTRAALLRGVARARDPWNVLELATDSVLSREPLGLETPGLGGWERKPWEGGAFLMRPGLRFALDRKEDHTAARGVGVKTLHQNRARVVRAWERSPLQSVTLPTPSFFHGAKLSVRRLMLPDIDEDERAFAFVRSEHYGRWTEETKTLSYSPKPKRESLALSSERDRDGNTQAYRMTPWELPTAEGLESAPYGSVGQSTLADDLDWMRDLEEDQPEPGMVRML